MYIVGMDVIIAIVVVFGLVCWNTVSERRMQDRLSGRNQKPPSKKTQAKWDEDFINMYKEEENRERIRKAIEAERARDQRN